MNPNSLLPSATSCHSSHLTWCSTLTLTYCWGQIWPVVTFDSSKNTLKVILLSWNLLTFHEVTQNTYTLNTFHIYIHNIGKVHSWSYCQLHKLKIVHFASKVSSERFCMSLFTLPWRSITNTNPLKCIAPCMLCPDLSVFRVNVETAHISQHA